MLEDEKKKTTSRTKEGILQEFRRAQQSGDEETAWRMVSSYHNRPGNVVVTQLLDAFLEHSANGRETEATSSASLLTYAGDLGSERAGDRFFSDVAHVYTSAAPDRIALLRRARELMRKGHENWGLLKFPESFELFSRAKQLFEQGENVPEAKVAEYWMSFSHYHDRNPKESLAILLPLISFCEANGYVWLRARCLYLRSAIHFNANEYSKAVNAAMQSAELSERTNDPVGLLNAMSSLIEYYRSLNNHRKMLSHIQRSLPLIRSIPLDPVQGARHYGFTAAAFASIGRNDAAAAYQREALRFASVTGSDIPVANSYAYLGMINGKLKNFDEALRYVRVAFDKAQSRSNEKSYKNLMAYASLQMGHIQRDAKQFDSAVESYDRAIAIYENQEELIPHLYQAHKGRLLCYIAQRNDTLAAEEITKTLVLVEEYRKKIHEENNRNAFFDVEQSVYDAAIDFAYSRHNNREQAFEYLEYSRSRSLLDLLKSDQEVLVKVRDEEIVFGSVSQPLPLADIKRRMPEQAQIVQYTVLEDKILIWVISKNDLQVVAKEVSQKELTEKVSNYVQTIASVSEFDHENVLRNAKDLFAVLIGPVESLLDANKSLCVIADKVLNRLPFATLVSPSSGRYLLEDYVLLSSPSPTIFVLSSENAMSIEGAKEDKVLSVGNPTFDRKTYSTLPDLPSSRREATEVASFYNASPLVETQASTAAVMNDIAEADVIHFALHSALDDEVPLRSKLLLAATPAAKRVENAHAVDSALHAYDVYNLKLRARLVVLSACQTGAERYYGGEGMSSLARPFIAAGVPLVVASLWPVDSDSAAELMISFHKYRRRDGLPTVAALQKAQLDMLRGAESRFHRPYHWAPFTIIGGYAKF
ncbi:MAG: CHAT domain-containing protein [Acidobacteria bacterium]|nr:CHAT domain-containing protein [Acidobacteriota bacterium]